MHLEAEIIPLEIGGSAFLTFEAPELSPDAVSRIAMHSALLLFLTRSGDTFRLVDKPSCAYLPRDLAEVLKYKGKTSATFTAMMLNCALASSRFAAQAKPVTVLDPMCGKGTTAFCALERGMNAIGVDVDGPALDEADRYMTRYLQLHRLKHQRAARSMTCQGKGVPQVVFTLSDTKEHFAQGDTRQLTLCQADTGLAAQLLRKTPAELLVTDLPYGIQHAPVNGRRPEPFQQLLRRVMPSWFQALRPGGAIAVSFNTLTLPRGALCEIAEAAGFEPVYPAEDTRFRHFVEQAVVRDVLLARRP